MKISGAVVLAVACIPTVGAFVSSPSNINLPIETTQLHAKQQHRADKEASWAVAVAGPTVALVAGVTLASQVAGASVPIGDAAILPESMPPIVRQQGKQNAGDRGESADWGESRRDLMQQCKCMYSHPFDIFCSPSCC